MSMDLDTQHFGEDGEYGTPKHQSKIQPPPRDHIFRGDGPYCKHWSSCDMNNGLSFSSECGWPPNMHPELPVKVGSLIQTTGGEVFFLTDKGWVGISGHVFYQDMGSGLYTTIYEGTKDPQ